MISFTHWKKLSRCSDSFSLCADIPTYFHLSTRIINIYYIRTERLQFTRRPVTRRVGNWLHRQRTTLLFQFRSCSLSGWSRRLELLQLDISSVGASRHHEGPIEGTPETSHASQQYGTEVLNGAFHDSERV